MNEISNSCVQKDENLLHDSHLMDNTANHLGDQTKCEGEWSWSLGNAKKQSDAK